MSGESTCAALGVDEVFAEPIRRMVDWSAADPQPVFWLIGGQHHLPSDFVESALPVKMDETLHSAVISVQGGEVSGR